MDGVAEGAHARPGRIEPGVENTLDREIEAARDHKRSRILGRHCGFPFLAGCQIEENDDRRIADGGVMAGEVEAAGFAIHT